MVVTKGSLVVMKEIRNNGIYSLIGSTVIGNVSNVSHVKNDKSSLWHRRLGHISIKGLQELTKQNLLCGDKVEGLNSLNTVFWASLREYSLTQQLITHRRH